ncbi:uncharacterized protein LOC119601073 [Lucilia sericata]|uniref:uncharacterized protein LOC119601073 n=1 Tax=Lucilia sericata TaxID=13632 RepID=UPI0018A87152|nr:uncharacterized protein LOC119601073 [Lucilia sericata]
MWKVLLRLSLVILMILKVSAKPQLLLNSGGLLGSLLGGPSLPPVNDATRGVVNKKDNLQLVDQRSELIGEFEEDSLGIIIPAGVNLPLDLLSNNLQIGEGPGRIQNLESNQQIFDQSADLIGIGHHKTGLAQVPIQANAPIKLIDHNTQIAEGPGGIENVKTNVQKVDQAGRLIGAQHEESDLLQVVAGVNAPIDVLTNNLQISKGVGGIQNLQANEQFVDQSGTLVGSDNSKFNLAQVAVQASAPIKALTQNIQIAEGPGGINNTRINAQIVDQSADLLGSNNQKLSGVQLPIAASAPINVLRKNVQTVANGESGNIDNVDINNQLFDQSSNIQGADNREANLLQGSVGVRAPINALTQNVQTIEGSEGDISNINVNQQKVDQSSNLKGKDLKKSSLLKLGALASAPIDLLAGNKQVITGGEKEGILNRILGSESGGIKNLKANIQNADLSDTLEGSDIHKTDGLLVAPQALLGITGLTKNLQQTSRGGIENVDLNAQKLNTDTNITGSNITKLQLGKITPQAQILVKLLNKNEQSTGSQEDEKGGILNAILNTQESTNKVSINGSNTKVIQLLDINPNLIVDLGLAELTDQKTSGSGSAKHKDITKQVSDNSVVMVGDNNEVIRGAVVNTQGVVKLRLGEIVKQVTGLVAGKELTDEECVEEGDDIIIQEQKSDVTQIGENNTISTLAKVGGQLIVDANVATNLLQRIRCKGRKTTTKMPPTEATTEQPILPPTGPPTLPPTVPPTLPPTLPSTQPPTLPPTQPPTLPPTLPPTQPPTLPPTVPPTLPPTMPPTKPPTLPPTQPPTLPPTQPPTQPPTLPPTQPPTQPPTLPPTKPPTQPPTQPPTLPPTQPPTQPPTLPPTQPPTLPPTLPPTQPPTLPPTQPPTLPPRRCYRKYCRKWRKMRYRCHRY